MPNSGGRLRIDFGTAGNSIAFQDRGWSHPENGFTWATGPASSLLLPPLAPGKQVLVVRGQPFLYPPDLRRQRLRFRVNGSELNTEQAFGPSIFCVDLDKVLIPGRSTRIEVEYLDAIAPSTFQGDDRRLLAFAWHSAEIFPSPFDDHESSPHHVLQARDAVTRDLQKWALREIAPWLGCALLREHLEETVERFSDTNHWGLVAFRFQGGKVSLRAKPPHVDTDSVSRDRAQNYLAFLQRVARRLPPDYAATVCFAVADRMKGRDDFPFFAFQKMSGETAILVPDVDFMQHDFYEGEQFQDCCTYYEKTSTAVFAGATTGGAITLDVAECSGLPRLEAADYFENHMRVDFRLPDVVQCTSLQAQRVLQSRSYCQRPRLSWKDQLRHRLQIVIDGNGATCSRVALALRSGSAPLKYDSPNLLYYFTGLTPGVHYIHIETHADVENVLMADLTDPDRHAHIAATGREFACRYLTRDRAEEYMAILLLLYDACFKNSPRAGCRAHF